MKVAGSVPASVRQRLLDRARRDNRPLNELLQYYAMERFRKNDGQPHRWRLAS